MNDQVIERFIKKIKFTLFSPEMIRRISVVKLIVPDTYNEDGYPIDGGLVDTRMGVIDPGLRCKTCGGSIKTCPGHFGTIELVRPVVHPEFSPIIYLLLKATCDSCRRVLISEEGSDKIKKKMSSSVEASLGVIDKAKREKICPYCNTDQSEIKFEKPTTFYKNDKSMLPTEIRDELAKISDEDLKLLGFDPESSRPEWSVLTVLIVPPVSVRPSITLETGERSEDDLTHKLVDVMRINKRLEANINAGAPQLIIEDLWELLQYHITTYFNNESPNIPPARHRSGKSLKTLAQRLKGKEGRFRYNLSGKRVNFSARTNITPDGTLSINQVGIPPYVADTLTVPIHVTDWNLAECKKRIEKETPPKALYVVSLDGRRRKITDQNKEEILNELSAGWIIERQLKNNDIVLFNRQPSLHRMSIMAHEVKILPGKSFRISPNVCPPYNADFDGDEMNLHVAQNEEARAEAELLMKVEDQIISPRHGHALISPTQDYVSGVYMLTKKDSIFNKKEACDMLALCGIYNLPKPDGKLEDGCKGYSGKLLISQLLPKGFNLEERTKLCKCEKCPKEKCPTEGYILIKDGQLIAGALEKKTFSQEIIEALVSNYSPKIAREFIDNAARMISYVITTRGFSVSLDSHVTSIEVSKKIDEIAERADKEVNGLVMQYKNKTLERAPGRTLRETLEQKIMLTLGKARNQVGDVLEKEFSIENSAIMMARTGARGSMLNVTLMSGIISQQSVRDKRLKRGFRKRVLSCFKRGDIGAKPRGYISSNFMKGLNPAEFFFHSMGGRDSMVNTAIRTARSGYMQRRFIHALQDLSIHPDGSVRDASGLIIETKYGGDGLDPMTIRKIKEEFELPEME